MNTLSLKYKSLFYSLFAHIFLALLLVAVYMKEEKKHEVYSLVKLQSMTICAPSTDKVLEKKQEKPLVKKASKLLTKKIIEKPIKPIEKKELKKKIIPVQKLTAKEIVVQKPKLPVEKVEKASVEEVEKIVAETEAQVSEQSAPAVAVSKPKLSYEAQYIQDNIALINALIKKNLFYPRLAKKRGLQGEAMVSFTLSLNGEVLEIEALGDLSSILKKSAIKTIKKASFSFPHPQEVLALRIPIVYKLH